MNVPKRSFSDNTRQLKNEFQHECWNLRKSYMLDFIGKGYYDSKKY